MFYSISENVDGFYLLLRGGTLSYSTGVAQELIGVPIGPRPTTYPTDSLNVNHKNINNRISCGRLMGALELPLRNWRQA